MGRESRWVDRKRSAGLLAAARWPARSDRRGGPGRWPRIGWRWCV